MSYQVRFTSGAQDDLLRLYDFILDATVERGDADFSLAERAIEAIRGAIALLTQSPFSCRKALPGNPFLRELVIPFGASGYVALFEIDNQQFVSILAVRHQREDDYH